MSLPLHDLARIGLTNDLVLFDLYPENLPAQILQNTFVLISMCNLVVIGNLVKTGRAIKWFQSFFTMFLQPFFILLILNRVKQCLLPLSLLIGLFCVNIHLILFFFFLIILNRLIQDRSFHQFINISLYDFIGKTHSSLLEQTSLYFILCISPFIIIFLVHPFYYKSINMEIQPQSRLTLIAQHIKTAPESSVLYASQGNAISVILNRPKALNSLNLEMIRDLDGHLDLIKTHQVAWFQGYGGKAFCAGGDVKVLFEKDSTVQGRRVFFREEFSLDYKVAQMETIQISCWDGIVMGGGVGISGFAPIIIATEKTLFAMPQAKLGFFTDVGSSYILARLRNNIGHYLGMTGARLKGEDVFVAGIAHFYIHSSKIPEAKQDVFKIFGSKLKIQNPLDVIRNILQKYHTPTGKTKLQNQEKIRSAFSYTSASQIYLKLKSSQDDFAKYTVKILQQQCPTSVSLIHRLITSSKTLALKEAFLTDTIIVENMASCADFKEGVRCVLMEKGAIPKWSFDIIPKVPSSAVEQFLIPVQASVPFK